MSDPWKKWVGWVKCHPVTIAYVLLVSTINLVLNLLEVLK